MSLISALILTVVCIALLVAVGVVELWKEREARNSLRARWNNAPHDPKGKQ